MKSHEEVLKALFGDDCDVGQKGSLLAGHATLDSEAIAVCGTCERAYIGVELAFELATFVLDTVRRHPGRPILMLVDNLGHRLSRRDELLGNNGYLAHLGQCMELARLSGHRVIGLVYGEAVSGGFLATGMSADTCYALKGSALRVMNLPAMARITRLPLERLETLCEQSPIFAPGVENFVKMGAVEAIWADDIASCLRTELLSSRPTKENTLDSGKTRGGRALAGPISDLVQTAS